MSYSPFKEEWDKHPGEWLDFTIDGEKMQIKITARSRQIIYSNTTPEIRIQTLKDEGLHKSRS